MKKLGTPQGTTTEGGATKCENVDKIIETTAKNLSKPHGATGTTFTTGGGELQTFKKTDEMIMEINEN